MFYRCLILYCILLICSFCDTYAKGEADGDYPMAYRQGLLEEAHFFHEKSAQQFAIAIGELEDTGKAHQLAAAYLHYNIALVHLKDFSHTDSLFDLLENELAEPLSKSKELQADLAYVKGLTSTDKDQALEACRYLKQSIELNQEVRPHHRHTVLAQLEYLRKCYLAYQFQEAEEIFDEALANSIEVNGYYHLTTSKLLNSQASGLYLQRKVLDALAHINRAIAIDHKILGDCDPFLADKLLIRSRIHRAMKNYNQLIVDLHAALKILKDNKNQKSTNQLIKTYNSLAIAYRLTEDFDNAIHYGLIAKKMVDQHYLDFSFTSGSVYTTLSYTYYKAGQLDKAIEMIDVSIDNSSVKKFPNASLIYIGANSVKGSYMIKQDKPILAKKHFQNSIDKTIQTLGKKNSLLMKRYVHPGAHFLKTGHFEIALDFLLKANSLDKKTKAGSKKYVASSLIYTSECYRELGDLDKSFEYLHEVGKMLFDDYQNIQLSVPNSSYDKYKLENISLWYRVAGKLQLKLFEQNKDLAYLKAASQNYKNLISGVKNQFLDEVNRKQTFNFLENAQDYFDEAVEVEYLLYKQTQDQKYLLNAYHISENSRSNALKKNIQTELALSVNSISPELANEEAQLRISLVELEKKLKALGAKEDSISNQKKHKYNQEINNAEVLLAALQRKLQDDSPEYYQAKYNISAISYEELAPYLKQKNTALLQYQWTQTGLYLFVLTAEGINGYHIENTSDITHHLENLQKKISSPIEVEEEGDKYHNFLEMCEHSHELFQLLFPFDLSTQTKRLVIVPSGPLVNLPFEALITSAPECQSEKVPKYLLSNFDISYEQSASLMFKYSQMKGSDKTGYAGFAPEFSEVEGETMISTSRYYTKMNSVNPNSFSPLFKNRDEVKNAAKTLNGKSFLGRESNESQFKNIADEYGIIHLATHAFTNHEFPRYSGMVFNHQETDSLEDGILHAYEISLMRLNNELVVLSACNTGTGKLSKADGALSIARAFRYAGSPNIIMSQWQVHDIATEKIITSFFTYLKQGLPKDRALRLAKLDYLQSGGNMHPYYWAPFILLGNEAPIASPSTGFSQLFSLKGVFTLFLIIGMAFFFWRVIRSPQLTEVVVPETST